MYLLLTLIGWAIGMVQGFSSTMSVARCGKKGVSNEI